jgi:hypothetical protein
MSKAQNKKIRKKRMPGNMAPQKTNNTIADLVEREGNKYLAADTRITIIIFNDLKEELKEDIQQTQLNEYKENTD